MAEFIPSIAYVQFTFIKFAERVPKGGGHAFEILELVT